MEIQTYRREQPFGIITRRRYSATDNSVVHTGLYGRVIAEDHGLDDKGAAALLSFAVQAGFTHIRTEEA